MGSWNQSPGVIKGQLHLLHLDLSHQVEPIKPHLTPPIIFISPIYYFFLLYSMMTQFSSYNFDFFIQTFFLFHHHNLGFPLTGQPAMQHSTQCTLEKNLTLLCHIPATPLSLSHLALVVGSQYDFLSLPCPRLSRFSTPCGWSLTVALDFTKSCSFLFLPSQFDCFTHIHTHTHFLL